MKPLPIEESKKLGAILRKLREDAGLTRKELQEATGVAASTIRNCEMCRHQITAWTLGKLLAHASMRELPALADAEGIKLSFEEDEDEKADE